MESIIINTNSRENSKLFTDLAKKMGLTTKILSAEELEEIGLLHAMEEARKTPFVSREKVMQRIKENANII